MSTLLNFVNQNQLLSLLLLALQIGFIVHVFVQRRPIFWVFVLFFIPVVGVLLYFFFEVLPNVRVRRADFDPIVERLQTSDQRIRARREALEDIDTLQNRVNLASELTRANRLDEAEETLRPLQQGLYKDDPQLLFSLADLKIRQGRDAEARDLLVQLDATRNQSLSARTKVLLAGTLVRLGDKSEAERQLRAAMTGAITEEPRVRLAEFLLDEGRTDEAKQLLDAVEKTYRRANNLYRTQEREWFRLAEQLRGRMK